MAHSTIPVADSPGLIFSYNRDPFSALQVTPEACAIILV